MYTHGPGIDEPLSRENLTTGAVEYYHADGLGSIVKMTNSAGGIVQARQYDAYGNLEAGADQAGFAYTGREWDPETGLYYYRARYYEARSGRFISEDPIGFAGGINVYRYVRSSPVNLVDPSGLRDGKTGWQPPTGRAACFWNGFWEGVGTGLLVVGGAVVAVEVGVPMAVVTAGLGVVGIVGGGNAIYEGVQSVQDGNYDNLVHTAGGILGGAVVGGGAAQSGVFPGANPNNPWTSSGGKGIERNPEIPLWQDLWNWFGTGVDKASGTGVTGAAGGGAATSCGCE